MKLVCEKLAVGINEGLICKTIRTRQFECYWHIHDEYELTLTSACPGYRIVGDNICQLKAGDLVLLGGNLPHLWHHEHAASEKNNFAEIHLIQFEKNLLGERLMQQPSLTPTRQLLQRAVLGLSFHGKTREQISRMMLQIEKVRGLRRLSMFISILDILSLSREFRSISSSGFSPELNPFNQERMNSVFRFINDHLADPICLEDAARLLHLSAGAFSRFFRRHTARTFPEFVNELRIGRACRLLAETEMTITEIAMASGFTNLSNFNRQFMRLKKLNPRSFRNRLIIADV